MQILVNGIIDGLALSMFALAFTAVYLPTRVFFIALAGVYSLVPYVAWQLRILGFPWMFAAGTAVATGVLICIACELANHKMLERKRASPGAHLISSLGIFIILVQLVVIIWGNESKTLRTVIQPPLKFGAFNLTQPQLLAAGLSVVVLSTFYLWLRRSNIGLRFYALADNPTQLALYGYNTSHLRVLGFALSGLLSSFSSLVVAYDLGFDPHRGLHALLLALVAMIIGGSHSFWAPLIGGILLGVVRVEAAWYLSARWQDMVTFLLLVVVMLFRPTGLLRKRTTLEAEST